MMYLKFNANKVFKFLLILFFSIDNQNAISQGPLIPYRKGKNWGYADTNAKIIIEPKFWFSSKIFYKNNIGYAFVVKKDSIKRSVACFTGKENYIIPFDKHSFIMPSLCQLNERNLNDYYISNNLIQKIKSQNLESLIDEAPLNFIAENYITDEKHRILNRIYTLYDAKGKQFFMDTLYKLEVFLVSNNEILYEIHKENKIGIINNKGETIIPIKYSAIQCHYSYNEKYIFRGVLNDSAYILNEKNEILLKDIHENYKYITIGNLPPADHNKLRNRVKVPKVDINKSYWKREYENKENDKTIALNNKYFYVITSSNKRKLYDNNVNLIHDFTEKTFDVEVAKNEKGYKINLKEFEKENYWNNSYSGSAAGEIKSPPPPENIQNFTTAKYNNYTPTNEYKEFLKYDIFEETSTSKKGVKYDKKLIIRPIYNYVNSLIARKRGSEIVKFFFICENQKGTSLLNNLGKSVLPIMKSISIHIIDSQQLIVLKNFNNEEAVFDLNSNKTVIPFDNNKIQIIKNNSTNEIFYYLEANGTTTIKNKKNITIRILPHIIFNNFLIGSQLYFRAKDNQNKYGIISELGKIIVPFQYSDVEFYDYSYKYNETAFNFLVYANNSKNKGLINAKGLKIMDTVYEDITLCNCVDKDLNTKPFEGFYKVKQNGKFGIIDTLGRIIKPTIYSSIDFCDRVLNNENEIKIISLLKYQNFYYAKLNNKYGVVDSSKKVVVPFEYDLISLIDKYEYLDRVRYKTNDYFKQDSFIYFQVKKNNLYGVINNKNTIIQPIQFPTPFANIHFINITLKQNNAIEPLFISYNRNCSDGMTLTTKNQDTVFDCLKGRIENLDMELNLPENFIFFSVPNEKEKAYFGDKEKRKYQVSFIDEAGKLFNNKNSYRSVEIYRIPLGNNKYKDLLQMNYLEDSNDFTAADYYTFDGKRFFEN